MASFVVVGGGVAGLTCAWRLRRAGHDVEVLERASQPGGRIRSERQGEFVLERGAQFIASGYRNLHGVARALGIGDRVQRVAPAREAILRDGVLHPLDYGAPLSLLRSNLLSRRAKWRLARLAFELARRWPRLDPLHPETAAELDVENLADGFTRVAGREACEFLFAPAFSATFDAEPEDLSWAFGLLALRFAAGGAELQCFAGGMGLLTQTLARQVSLRADCEVVSIETETEGARVRYRTRGRMNSVIADAAVVALPGSRVAAVCPKLTPAERGFFEDVRYGSGIVVHLLLEQAPATLPYFGVAFPRSEGLDLYGLAVDHHKPGVAPAGTGLVNAALTARAAGRMWQASDASIADLVLENLAYTPVGRLAPLGFAVHRYEAMLPCFGPGYLARLARFENRVDRSPRLAFAGDYLVGPTAEGALTSGMRAATEIARAL